MKSFFKPLGFSWLSVLAILLCLARPAISADDWQTQVRTLLKDGALLVADQTGQPILAINPDKALIPASTLKVLTSAAAMEYLGPEYRFVTDFRLSTAGDLWIVGSGDPFLVSEEIDIIARTLKDKGLTRINRLFLDNRFFIANLVLDGTERTLNPYDAYNGALCVNFNTIFVQIGPGRTVTSAEPQTPLTDMAREMALRSGSRGQVRFNLAESPQTCLLYAGDLIKTFLQKAGVEVRGRPEPAVTDPNRVPLFYRHTSTKSLPWLLTQMLEYSNNFMANQIFLTIGAQRYGPPATPEKARRVITDYLTKYRIPQFHVEEGSGLSMRTMVSAKQLLAVLKEFVPHKSVLRRKENYWYKGGSLTGVKTLAGYIETENKGLRPFVIFINHPAVKYDDPDRILELVRNNL